MKRGQHNLCCPCPGQGSVGHGAVALARYDVAARTEMPDSFSDEG